MGQAKTDRTEQLHKAARRYVVGKQVEQAIEQHNFDRLIYQGLIVREVIWESEPGAVEMVNLSRTSSIKPAELTVARLINWRDEQSMLKKDEGGGREGVGGVGL